MTFNTSHVNNPTQEHQPDKELEFSRIYMCPLCKKKLQIYIDIETLEQLFEEMGGVIPHIILHGEPLHAMLCYIDRQLAVRGKTYIASLSICRDSSTYQQFIRLWSRSNIELLD